MNWIEYDGTNKPDGDALVVAKNSRGFYKADRVRNLTWNSESESYHGTTHYMILEEPPARLLDRLPNNAVWFELKNIATGETHVFVRRDPEVEEWEFLRWEGEQEGAFSRWVIQKDYYIGYWELGRYAYELG